MGAWGIYDDENDNTADNWSDIEYSFLPPEIAKVRGLIGDIDYDMQQRLFYKYMIDNLPKVYSAVNKFTNDKWKQSDKVQVEKEADIAGAILYLIRQIAKNESSTIFSVARKQQKIIPSKLPKGFPAVLAKSGEKAVLKMLSVLGCNKLGWDDLDMRELALKHELYLFTNGKHKLAIKPTADANYQKVKKVERECIETDKQLSRRTTKNTKDKSFKEARRTSKKYASRPSPSVSAQEHPNKIMKGNDGYKWKSKPNINGVYQWKKLK